MVGDYDILHLDQDHSFIILEGEMTVFDEKGDEMVLKRYQGIVID